LLSSFTWNGGASDGNWDNGANWVGGNAPTSGTVDIVLQNIASPQTITLQADDAAVVLNSIMVQGGSYTLQGTTGNHPQTLVLSDGGSLNVASGASLAICPNRLTSSDANSLALDLLGSATKSGAGTLVLNNDVVLYKAPPTLQLFQINGGTSILRKECPASLAE
jgi:hypothetical protein